MGNANTFFKNLGEGLGNNINSCIIAKVQDYDNTKNTITAIPLHEGMPPLIEVPVMVLGNQDFNIKFPISKNDMVLVLFIDYDIDNLVIDGVTTTSASNRRHSINDSIALPFFFSSLKTQFNASNMLTLNSKTDIELMYSDESIKITELMQKINDLENRVTILEGRI